MTLLLLRAFIAGALGVAQLSALVWLNQNWAHLEPSHAQRHQPILAPAVIPTGNKPPLGQAFSELEGTALDPTLDTPTLPDTLTPLTDSHPSLLGDGLKVRRGRRPSLRRALDRVPQADVPPRLAEPINPEYPPLARRRGVEGEVVLRIDVDISGRPQRIEIVESQPPGVFDNAAVAAVQNAVFQPALRRTQRVRAQLEQRILFRLTDPGNP